MKSNEIRSSFLNYFADRDHKIVPSSPLIPHDDPTLLFINAGMNQFKGVFQGKEKRDYLRAASSQKCIRAGGKHNDLENVGFTARHHTFFEMLGNFSFGDYFKEEAIVFAWEYVTKTIGLDPKRLYATVFTKDDEAERLWKRIAPELGDRVLRFGREDNYWSMGDIGPCGPCSELHYDRGDKYPGELNGDGDRFMEIWNLVFMQFNRDETGKLTPLPKPSVDTGAGLERFCMILQDGNSNYETDLFLPLISKIAEVSNREYSIDSKGVSHRVIADHLRALTFAIADGGIISNEGRGYVLRRILRRAARHGRLLDMHEPFLHKLVGTLTDMMGDQFPEISSKRKHIELVLQSEEEQFGRTLDTGLEIFEDIVKKAKSSDSKVIPGADVFRLYDTFGFPADLTEVMAAERGLHADMKSFEEELAKQRKRSIRSSSFKAASVEVDLPKTTFSYDKPNMTSKVLYVGSIKDDKFIVLDQTPFYAESGGQIGDTGAIASAASKFLVNDTQKSGDATIHLGNFGNSAFFEMGIEVIASVDNPRRAEIENNHTATHLLHKALREVLGDHVHQSGSLVAQEKLRFDFTYGKGMTPVEITRVEKLVRVKINENLTVTRGTDIPLAEAKEMGAMALFGEKYGETVTIIEIGDFSLELCGGTHVDNTADIGEFFITQETAIAAGMRRIEAVTGRRAREFIAAQEMIVVELSGLLKKGAENLSSAEIVLFNDLFSKADRRYLTGRGILESYDKFADSIKQVQRQRVKVKVRQLSDIAGKIEPIAVIGEDKICVYVVPAGNAGEVMVFSDLYKNIHPDSSVITISQSTGNFAITSGANGIGQEIMNAMKSISGVRGGGKPTVRGSLPVSEIESVINILIEKFDK
ncbi:MAG: alanine--tRNA ligase [candidate division Zixibacteria bacterium]